ncbi:MAG: NAD(P)H-dependent oxidoreductase [Candidatus Omnitrophica bacterium]|nr:NAD(P)H-dependent oxidoreductase [Candidatus Omnitrophota bacterium]
MSKALIIYYSRSGNTAKMAQEIAAGIKEEGIEVDIKKINEVKPEMLFDYDAIIIGSPTYYGSMAAQIKSLLDETVRFHGKLDAKIGAAFSSAANIGGGNETTILDILHAMLIHGMIIQGDPSGDHYGTVAINKPDSRSQKGCLRQGKRIAGLIKRLK